MFPNGGYGSVEAQAPPGYAGRDFSLKGEKDRFVLPPQFRKAVFTASNNAKTLCLLKHDRWNCLTGFGTLRANFFDAQVDREEGLHRGDLPFDRDKRMGDLWSYKMVPFDDSGRFVIPESLLLSANITDKLYYKGGSPFFTLWNPEELYKMDESWESDKIECRLLERDALAKARKV
jgi:MraZ protein